MVVEAPVPIVVGYHDIVVVGGGGGGGLWGPVAVFPGHQVVTDVTVSVVLWPTGQLVTVGAHEVTVYTVVE